ncbi:hypothetical protein HYX10_00030 [Candidatus Woesearchaeota archaeon]|nr:hypothetical protein [Candidatus Woesearchaeota archaeon]
MSLIDSIAEYEKQQTLDTLSEVARRQGSDGNAETQRKIAEIAQAHSNVYIHILKRINEKPHLTEEELEQLLKECVQMRDDLLTGLPLHVQLLEYPELKQTSLNALRKDVEFYKKILRHDAADFADAARKEFCSLEAYETEQAPRRKSYWVAMTALARIRGIDAATIELHEAIDGWVCYNKDRELFPTHNQKAERDIG